MPGSPEATLDPGAGGWRARARKRRALRALARQLDYQHRKARAIQGNEQSCVEAMIAHSRQVREKLEAIRPIADDADVLEVGSGAQGLIFHFGAARGVGIDPLADFYASAFPAWQGDIETVTGFGEALPFADGRFDIILCDNVVDHAEDPARIVAEIARVLAPGGLLYFTVNVHHPVYHLAATAHSAWRAVGVPVEIGPFADHTVHLTLGAARNLFRGLPLRMLRDTCDLEKAKLQPGQKPRHAIDGLRRLFFKNALLEIIAVREA